MPSTSALQNGYNYNYQNACVSVSEEQSPTFANIISPRMNPYKLELPEQPRDKNLNRFLFSSRKARIQFPSMLLPTILGGAMPCLAEASSMASASSTESVYSNWPTLTEQVSSTKSVDSNWPILTEQVSSTEQAPSTKPEMEDFFTSSRRKYFPGAVENEKFVMERLVPVLKRRGYARANTLMGSSLCSDEIVDGISSRSLCHFIHKKFGADDSGKGDNDLIDNILTSSSSGIFNLGGLGGVPAVGTTGFGAFFSHCPSDGKIIVVYGPHVGISKDGAVGKVERLGQRDTRGISQKTSSCGAALGAYKVITSGETREKKTIKKKLRNKIDSYNDGIAAVTQEAYVALGGKRKEEKIKDVFDYQQSFIVQQLKKRIDRIQGTNPGDKNAEIAALMRQMYEIIDEVMTAQIRVNTAKEGFFDGISDLVLVGGIVINGGFYTTKQDYFQPLSMREYSARGVKDLSYELAL